QSSGRRRQRRSFFASLRSQSSASRPPQKETDTQEEDTTPDKIRELQLLAREKWRAGEVVDPAAKGQGWTPARTHGRPSTGQKTGKAQGLKTNRREAAGPVLRQDMTAYQRLYLLQQLDQALGRSASKASFQNMPSIDRQSFLRRFQVTQRFCYNCIEKRQAYEGFVAGARTSVTGLRPFGTTRPGTRAQGKGCRLRSSWTIQPLRIVYQRIKAWFAKERQYGHQLQHHHLLTRLKLELATELGRQQVLQEHESKHYSQKVQEACQTRLHKL
ncbi:MAG: hypothetical protein GY772_19855, partial [bacterium]|nr:hypothetical protein [bacterium]